MKKMMKAVLALAMGVAMGLSAQAANRTDSATITLSGGQTTVQASGNVAGGGTPSWTASQALASEVARVTGITTGRRPVATIVPVAAGYSTCAYGNTRDTSVWTLNLTVTDSKAEDVALALGGTKFVQKTCSYSGKYATGAAQWSATTDDDKVATVSSVSGYNATVMPTITAVGAGTTTVTVKNAYITYTYTVTVTEPDPAEGTMNGAVKAYSDDVVTCTTTGDWANMRLVYDAGVVSATVSPAGDSVAQKGVVTIRGLAETEATTVKLYSGDTLVKTITVTVNKNDEVEAIALMASETVEITSGDKVALKWVATPDELAGERLAITTERLVDSSAKVTITANGTAAAAKPAVIALYGDKKLVKRIVVTITEKKDKDYLAENTTDDAHSVINPKDAIIVHADSTWQYTTVTKGSNWTLTRADGTYKSYNLSSNFSKYMYINGSDTLSNTMNLTANVDGTVTFSVTGKDSAGTKALILSLRSNGTEVMKVQIIVDQSVEDIKLKKGATVSRSGTYNDTSSSRHWVFDNDGSDGNIASLALKYNGNAAAKTSLSLPAYPDFKWMTSSWNKDFTADITGNKLGSQVIRIARINNTDASSFSTMYQYNVFVYDEATDRIDCKAGDVIADKEFTSEAAGAWEATSSDPTVVTVTEAGWTDTSFKPEIKALKAGTATLTIKNNFITYTVTVTVAKGKEIKNISIEKGQNYVAAIAGGASVSSDAEGVATITLNSATQATITGVAAGDAVCTVYDAGSNPTYEYNVKVFETKTADALIVTGKTVTVSLTSAEAAAWTAVADDGTVVQVVNPESGAATDTFGLQLKGLKVGTTKVRVENDYAKYTVNVTVSGDVKKIEQSVSVGAQITTNLTFGSAVYWVATAEAGEDVVTVNVGQEKSASMTATIETLKPGLSQWTVYVKESEGGELVPAYTLSVKVREEVEFSLDMQRGMQVTTNLTSAAQDSWTAVSSVPDVATVTETGVSSTEFAPIITALADGETTITAQNGYAVYTIHVKVSTIIAIPVPTAKTGLVYDGTIQTGVATGDGYTLTGTFAAKDAGDDYTATAMPKEGYCWEGGATGAKTIAWSIGRATATVTAVSTNKVYGATEPTFTYTVTGTNGFDGAEITCTSIVRTNDCEDVGSYDIVPSGNVEQGDNYTVEFVAGTLEITRKVIEKPTAESKTLTYNGGCVTGVVANTGFTVAGNVATNAGTYTATATLDSNHKWADDSTDAATVDFTIAPAKIAVKADDKSVKEGDPAPEYTYTVTPELFGDDKLEGSLVCAYDRATAKIGDTFDILQGTLTNENYTITSFTMGKLTVASLQVALSPAGKVYDGTPLSTNGITFTVTDAGQPVTDFVVVGTNSMLDAGTYTFKVTAGGLEGSADFVVTQKTVTVTANADTKTYGDADPTFTAAVSGTIGTDTVSYTVSRKSGENVGEYQITASGNESQGNYKVTFVPATFTITPKAVTVRADTTTKTYGEGVAFTSTVTGTNGTDGATIAFGFNCDTGSVANVGSYVIKPVSTKSGYTSNVETQGNYAVTYDWSDDTAGRLVITPKSVTVTSVSTNMFYGGIYPITSTVTGLVYGDTLDYKLGPVNCNGDVGEYAIGVISYNTNNNYTVDFSLTGCTLTIERLPVFVTVVATNKVYGAEDPAFTYVVSNAERTAELTVLSNGTDVVLNGYLVRTAGEDVKDSPYDVDTLTYFNETNNPNYVFEAALDGENKFTILPALLTVTADDKTKVYGEKDPEFTATVQGLQFGEEGTDIVYTVTRVMGENVGTYAITPTGTTPQGGTYGKNYDIAYSNGTFTITAKSLTDDMAVKIPNQRWAHGEAVTNLTVKLTDYGSPLTQGVDWQIKEWGTNTDPGTGTVVIEGLGNYKGTITNLFKILSVEETMIRETFEDYAEISHDEKDDVCNWTIKLTNDLEGAVEILDNLGDVVIDLNEHAIVGMDGDDATESAPAMDGEPAIRIISAEEAGSTEDGTPTSLWVVDNSGEPADPGLKGGKGGNDDFGGKGGNGGAGVKVETNTVDGVEVTIVAPATAEGGFGGDGDPNGEVGLDVDSPMTEITASIEVADDMVREGSNIVVRVTGGSRILSSSVQLQAVYETAAAADLDLKNVTINDELISSFKFPYTLTWNDGDVKTKTIVIPVKEPSKAKMNRNLTLKLQNPMNVKLKGVDGKSENKSYCQVTIMGQGGSVKEKVYVRATPNDATRGKTSGSALVAKNKKVTVKATANKGYVFTGWYDQGDLVERTAKYAFTATADVDLVARFEPLSSDYLTLENDFLPTEIELGKAFSNAVSVASGSLPTITVSGLPKGLKYDKTANVISGTPTKAATAKVKVTVKNLGGYKIVRTYEVSVVSKPMKTESKILSDANQFFAVSAALLNDAAGKVTGAKLYQAGKKVTMKATANKGYVFAAWLDENGETKSTTASYSFTMPSNNVSLVAKFALPDEITNPSGKGGYGVAVVRNNDFAGNVTGAGYYAAGKKVSLKATALKGYVFSGWYEDDKFAKLITQNASLIIASMPADNVRRYAKFVTAGEDDASILASVNGTSLERKDKGVACLTTDVMCGVALRWPVAASALSLPTVKVSGLPSGLKFTAKDIMKKGSKTEVDIPANTIYGAPTAASSIDKATNQPKPSKVKVTVTTSGKSKVEYQIALTVDPLPDYAVGTFDGPVFAADGTTNGVVKLTVAKNGKISGTVQTNCLGAAAKKLTLSVASFAALTNGVFYLMPTYKDGKTTVEVPLTLAGVAVDGGTIGAVDGESLVAYQNVLKGATQDDFVAPERSDLDLTVAKDGVLKFAGTVGSVKVSGSSQIYYDADDKGYRAVIYAPSKTGFDGIAEIIKVDPKTE